MTTPEAPLREEPLCGEPDFAALVEGLVADLAPRLFALVEEAGERMDGRIFAWSMAFEDHAEAVGADRSLRGSFESADDAYRLFSHCTKLRLVWYNPDAATWRNETA
ncbi:MAG: hypothetical protein ACRDQU_19300 [Pseudonocardiaceae bacterium]